MESIREPAVAGTFYPLDPVSLSSLIDTYLEGDTPVQGCPKAIIAPHAGFVYSGPIAGAAYRELTAAHDLIKRVVLLGPSHRVAFRGMAVSSATHFRTPLGDVPLDTDGIKALTRHKSVGYLDEAHTQEHSLEVHLPFLQQVLDEFTLIPIVVGDTEKEQVASVIASLWEDDETLFVISSDLSHYESYDRATELDAKTSSKITALNPTLVGSEACGCKPVNGLLHYLKTNNLGIETIDVRNSGDTAGSRDRVVGYGAWRVNGKPNMMDQPEWSLAERQTLIGLSREAIRSPLSGEKNFNVDLNQFSPPLRDKRATFVTINIDGRLRGCIGSLNAQRPLALDVAYNAQAAAFKDPRFTPLTAAEYQKIDVHISVLSQPWDIAVASREDLINQLVPGKHGLIINDAGHQATYLPSVWAQLSTPEKFVTELRKKAGLPGPGWSEGTQVRLYTTEEFS